MDKDVISHHGVPGQKWGVRRQRDSNGNLTKYGAKKLSSKLNKLNKHNKNVLYMPISYKDKYGKAYIVHELNKNEINAYKRKVEKGASFGGIIGATIASKKYQIQKGKEITDLLSNGKVNYTTIIKDTSLNNTIENKRSKNTKYQEQKVYDKFHADDIEGIVKNMSKSQINDLNKHVSRDADWPEIQEYVMKKYK